MPLLVTCSCGKKLKVNDQLAGKKIKCPGCGAVLEAKSSQAQADGPKIQVVCTCGASLAVPASLAGKMIKCPKCQGSLVVEGDEDAGGPGEAGPAASQAPGQASPAPGGGIEPDDDEEGYELPNPKCKNCGTELELAAVICTQCGAHQVTGQKVQGFEGEAQKEATPGGGMPKPVLAILVLVVLLIGGAVYYKFNMASGTSAGDGRAGGSSRSSGAAASGSASTEAAGGSEASAPDADEAGMEREKVEPQKVFGDDSEWFLERMVYSPQRTREKMMLTNAQRAVKMFEDAEGRKPKSLEEVEKAGYGPIERPQDELKLEYDPETGKVNFYRLVRKKKP
jgi:hypothetical protein